MQHINMIIRLKYYRMSFFCKLILIMFYSFIILVLSLICHISPAYASKYCLIKSQLKYHRNKTCLNFNKQNQKNNTHHVIQHSYNINNQNYINFIRHTKKHICDVVYNFQNNSIIEKKNKQKKFFSAIDTLKSRINSNRKIAIIQYLINTKKNDQFFDSQQYLNSTFLKKTIFIKKNSNFFKAAYQFGLNQCEIKNIIDAMSGKINWKKLHVGSSFNLIFLNNMKKQNDVKDAKTKNLLLGIKLNNAKKTYYAIHALNGYFYDENGLNRETIFVNYNFLKKYRISSPFNLHRLHPITHKITRHLGIDVAMPQGTPVLAANNGTIIKSSFDNISGWHITLKSKHKYMTRYMHLKKILVKLGDIVKIGQKIALSGNTGRTTGPHLHYEVWIDNHAVNPENSRFIFSNKLTEKEKITYLNRAKKILQLLK